MIKCTLLNTRNIIKQTWFVQPGYTTYITTLLPNSVIPTSTCIHRNECCSWYALITFYIKTWKPNGDKGWGNVEWLPLVYDQGNKQQHKLHRIFSKMKILKGGGCNKQALILVIILLVSGWPCPPFCCSGQFNFIPHWMGMIGAQTERAISPDQQPSQTEPEFQPKDKVMGYNKL